MPHYSPGLLAALLVLACSGDADAPPEPVTNEPHVLNGPATCDACRTLEFTVAGPDLDGVTAASLQNHTTRASVEASVEVRHAVGDSGLVLQIKLTFSGPVPAGEYDLLLDTASPGNARGALTVLRAVKVLGDLSSPPGGPTGTIRIVVTTTGAYSSTPYRVTVTPCHPDDNCGGQRVTPQDTVTIALPAGIYTVGLTDAPETCSVAEPRTVEISVVAYRFANVSFSVACPPPGTVRVAASVTGPDPDLNYLAVVGTCGDYGQNCTTQELRAGSSVEFSLAPGDHVMEIAGVAANCSVVAPNPRTVTVVPNAATNTVFVVNCVAAGKVRISAPTTGSNQPSGYQVNVGACVFLGLCTGLPLSTSESVEVTVLPGTYPVQLDEIPGNCSVSGANPVTVTVNAGTTTNVAFAVTCTALPNGTVRVSARTSGTYRDGEFGVIIVSMCEDFGCPERRLSADGFLDYSLRPGVYRFQLTDISPVCRIDPPNPASVGVVSGRTTNLVFQVSCR